MSLGKITVNLDLDNGKFTAKLRKAKGQVRDFSTNIDKNSAAIKRNEKATRSWGRRLRDTSLTLAAIPHALHSINTVILGLPRSIVTANAKLERMNQLMLGLADSSMSFAEAQADAQAKVGYMFDLADRTPFNIDALTDSFVKFRSVGLDPTNGSLQSLIDSVAKYGGTSQNLHRASIAVQQMAGKGVISMEELRQQLGESVPDAINIMARSMNMTMGELAKKVSMGVVEANNALKNMFAQMAKENSGAAKRMSETWDGLIGRLSAKWMKFQSDIGDQGGFAELKEVLSDLVHAFDDPSVKNAANAIGRALASTIRFVKQATALIYEHRDAIKAAAAVWLTYKAVGVINSVMGALKAMSARVVAAGSHWGQYRAEMLRLQNQHRVMQLQFAGMNSAVMDNTRKARAAAITNQYYGRTINQVKTASAMAAASVRRFGRAIAVAAGPVGFMAMAVYQLVDTLDIFKGKYEEINDMVKRGDFFTKQEDFDNAKGQMAEYAKEIDRLADRISAYKNAGFDDEVVRIREERLEALVQKYQGLNRQVIASRSLLNREFARKSFTTFKESMVNELDGIQRAATAKYKAIQDKLQKGSITSAESRDQNAAALAEFQAKTTAIWKREYEAKQRLADSLNKRNKSEILSVEDQKKRAAVNMWLKEVDAEIKRISEIPAQGFVEFISNANSTDKTKLQKELERVRVKFQQATAEAKNADKALAKFNQRFENGDFGKTDEPANQAMAAKIRDLLKKTHDLNEAEKERKENLKLIKSVNTVLINQSGRLTAQAKQLGQDNPWLKQSSGAKSLAKSLEQAEIKLRSIGQLTKGFKAAMSWLTERQSMNDMADAMFKMEQGTKNVNRELMTQRDRLTASHQEALAYLDEFYEANRELIESTPEWTKAYQSYVAALNRQFERNTETSWQRLAREWQDVSKGMEDVWAQGMVGMADSLTNFVMTGKLALKDFADEIVRMIIKIQMQKMVASAVTGMSNIFGGGGTAAAAPDMSQYNFSMDQFATGGIMTEHGRAPLRKYANGGVASSPQMALFGEGSRPEAFVPLPDGRNIPVKMQGGAPNVQVNVINESGQPVGAEQGEAKFDGKQMVLDVVLSAVNRPGNFRDGMKGALK